MRLSGRKNPFAVTTPESLSGREAVDLFVDVFSDFPKLLSDGHVFLHGPRGSGKSMILRNLQPDCQILRNECALGDLPFFSVYVSVKNTDLGLAELERLERSHATTLLDEHMLCLVVAQTAIRSFAGYASQIAMCSDHVTGLVREVLGLLEQLGWTRTTTSTARSNRPEDLDFLADVIEGEYRALMRYVKKHSFRSEPSPYDGLLCGFNDFVRPLAKYLTALPGFPRRIYLLVDDADNLNVTQARVLNSWVSTRSTDILSIKVTTQLQYPTYLTISGNRISSPHDYSDIHISTIYTTAQKGTYFDRIHSIVAKRLGLAGIEASPNDFFPPDVAQEREIAKIGERYREQWKKTEGRGHRLWDDAIRYARPDFIRDLGGRRKSRSTYSYAGFEQLVHLSSGIIRTFLETAALMYSDVEADKGAVDVIPPHVQDAVVRRYADDLLFREFEKLRDDKSDETPPDSLISRLYNLIRALGGTFQSILYSDRADRRVFAIAFSDEPSQDVREVLQLGARLGYLQLSGIGNKDGTGRTRLYVLSRTLAPHFGLDPTSFSGYLFVTNQRIEQAISSPKTLLRQVRERGVSEVFEPRQLQLFDEGESQ